MPEDGAPEAAPTDAPTPKEAPPAPPVEDWETRFKYLLADFENYRRRTDRDRDAAARAGRAAVLRSLLPLWEAFENAEAAVRHLPADDPVRAGLGLLRKEWEKFLRTEHVEPVARPGDAFSPDDQEAVAETEPSAKVRAGRIAEIVQQGYRSDVGLLRPAKVVVARHPAAPAEAEAVPSGEAKE